MIAYLILDFYVYGVNYDVFIVDYVLSNSSGMIDVGLDNSVIYFINIVYT